MGTDISVGGKSGSNVDFIRSPLVAEADEVFMANFGHGWNCGKAMGILRSGEDSTAFGMRGAERVFNSLSEPQGSD